MWKQVGPHLSVLVNCSSKLDATPSTKQSQQLVQQMKPGKDNGKKYGSLVAKKSIHPLISYLQ